MLVMPPRQCLLLFCLLFFTMLARAEESVPALPPACPTQPEASAARVTVGPYSLDAQTIRINLAADRKSVV